MRQLALRVRVELCGDPTALGVPFRAQFAQHGHGALVAFLGGDDNCVQALRRSFGEQGSGGRFVVRQCAVRDPDVVRHELHDKESDHIYNHFGKIYCFSVD
ncbi:hypothetical protein GCM10022267_40950 [Lentzea roselyniae]|uniref:Uncharacterized protein n=1 Tax=Lentzea roselyniae TaxID=531940 RepID=A0ABP7B6J1_9PSEU